MVASGIKYAPPIVQTPERKAYIKEMRDAAIFGIKIEDAGGTTNARGTLCHIRDIDKAIADNKSPEEMIRGLSPSLLHKFSIGPMACIGRDSVEIPYGRVV